MNDSGVILWGFNPKDGKRLFGTVCWHSDVNRQTTPKPPLILLKNQINFGTHSDPKFACLMGGNLYGPDKTWGDKTTGVKYLLINITLFKCYEAQILPKALSVRFERLRDYKLMAGLKNIGSNEYDPELAAIIAFIKAFRPS